MSLTLVQPSQSYRKQEAMDHLIINIVVPTTQNTWESLENYFQTILRQVHILRHRTDNDIKNHFYSTLRRSLRRLNKTLGQKNSTSQMREIKPSVLSTIMRALYGQGESNTLVQCLQDLPGLVFEFANLKPRRQCQRELGVKEAKQDIAHIFDMVAKFNEQYEQSKMVKHSSRQGQRRTRGRKGKKQEEESFKNDIKESLQQQKQEIMSKTNRPQQQSFEQQSLNGKDQVPCHPLQDDDNKFQSYGKLQAMLSLKPQHEYFTREYQQDSDPADQPIPTHQQLSHYQFGRQSLLRLQSVISLENDESDVSFEEFEQPSRELVVVGKHWSPMRDQNRETVQINEEVLELHCDHV